jgi:uncharacterized Zn-binding protein involved in type VI secretion
MPLQVVNAASTKCSMGTAPSQLVVLPTHQRTAGGQPAANVGDHIPLTNIVPFGRCKSPTFPATAAATASAGGTLTPMPCVPSIPAPWTPGSQIVTMAGQAAVRQTDKCLCIWGGTITITDPGQTIVIDA